MVPFIQRNPKALWFAAAFFFTFSTQNHQQTSMTPKKYKFYITVRTILLNTTDLLQATGRLQPNPKRNQQSWPFRRESRPARFN
jgi:hypothetical protein